MKTVIENYEFITYKYQNAEFVFSTAKNNLNFNKNTVEGKNNLNLLKKYFNLNEVGYLNQIHSDIILNYDGKQKDGDAIVTDRKNIGIGVFTADCVPVLIFDKKKNAVAAVHSGWKGTAKCIVSKTVHYMEREYGSCIEDLIIYIGPNNRVCCYDFGEELVNKFFNDPLYANNNIFVNGKLDLEKCIKLQLLKIGVSCKNINILKLCTSCSKEFEFYSYRREKEKSYGRMFSFIFIR